MTARRRQACARAPKRCRHCFRRSRKADASENELSEKSTMRRSHRLIATAVVIALSGALAGCGGGGMSSFDPSDLLDFLDTKKKLPGERKPVFPEGVPGLEQGVPKNLYKGSQQEQIDQQNAAAAAAAAPPPSSRSAAPRANSRPWPAARRAQRSSLPQQRSPMPRLRKRAAPQPRRPRPSPRRSCAGEPPRRRLMRPQPNRRHPRNRHNSLLRHSRRRCRAVRLRVNCRLLISLTCAS